ncbi:MAG: FIST C-terminal domain-containing protein [Deltaproteobacteria bacterium]|nr:FIST C-terminal domain-containing protein [Deltaproteobacteria bacterium]
MKIKAATGYSNNLEDAYEAGREAAFKAVSVLGNDSPAVFIVFTTPQYDLEALIRGVRSVCATARLVGGTGSGEIVEGTYLGFGAGVGVCAMTAGSYRFGLASVAGIKGRLETSGQSIARKSKAEAGASPHAALLLLSDCICGDLQELFQGAYRVCGPKVSITGGAVGDELKFERTFVFHDDQVIEGGAVGLWIASDTPMPVVTRHGWEPVGIPMLVTRAEGTEIMELGGRPAAEAYEEQLGFEPGELSVADFWGTSIIHPFGLLQSDGTSVIRVARTKTANGTLRIQGCVPPTGSAVQVMRSTPDELLNVSEVVVGEALSSHRSPGLLLVFSCAARAVIFGDKTPEESRRLQEAAGQVPTFGFYCCGEFARTAGVLGTHNATLTALAL